MNKIYMTLLFAFFMVVVHSYAQDQMVAGNQESITWYSWEEGVDLVKKTNKKMFIDVYTDWCGWCKKMDATTFQDPEVVKYMNENFVAVKFDAEQDKEIVFDNYTYKLIPGGRKGTHELALSLLKGRAGYPSFVMMDEGLRRIRVTPGYKVPDQMLTELKFAKEEAYKKVAFETYASSGGM
ncbi:MAG: DUF255 domain-containing protein [Saprospiraceae bacterium]|nr:DUF255 domain-containing protein [Saprospiraceae bacterium]